MSAEGEKRTHLIVEEGPDKGREISVPIEGGRIGRSSKNDIVLGDASLSRFHCRVYFRPDGTLWIADLGSTNQTLVNGKPIQDKPLVVGSRVRIGDTTLKVIRDRDEATVSEEASERARAEPAKPEPGPPSAEPVVPDPVGTSSSEPAHAAAVVDLGLREPAAAAPGSKAKRGHAPRWLWFVAGVVVLAAIAFAVARGRGGMAVAIVFGPKGSGVGLDGTESTQDLAIVYEKVEATTTNIFRYALTLKAGRLLVQADDLRNGRHIRKEGRVEERLIQKLAQSAARSGFFDLEPEYLGLVPNTHFLWDLSVTIDRRTRRVRVLNRIEPDAFKKLRREIEVFGQNEFGLIAMALTREQAIELAREAMLQGKKLYGEREVRYENLSLAIRSFDTAVGYLEIIEPKPSFYREVIVGREDGQAALHVKYQEHLFMSGKAVKLRDWGEAADNLRIICELIPDRGDERHRDAEERLIDVERRLR